ncbi:hypothetical protein LJR219_004770 [Phenylobacterium sp. LjRoot219]|uniref:hypothetical protein n=1 Tax=Phenylobacterium sp. LjRoot219 TaxID=3342283 RepID=UPI003ED0F69F
MSNMEASEAPGGPRSTKEMAATAAETVKHEAATFAGEAREKVVDKLEQQKQSATQTLGEFANAIRKAGDELDSTDPSMATRLVRQAADGLEGLARSVSDKRPEELLDAVRDFGRRNPTAFIAGSVLAGIAIGRFLKSSSSSTESSIEPMASSIQARAPATFSAADSTLGPDVYDPMLDPGEFADPTTAAAGEAPSDTFGDRGRPGSGG